VIKDYFLNYRFRFEQPGVVNLHSGDVQVRNPVHEDWLVHLLDTGEAHDDRGRVRRVMDYVGREPILLTYGDGVSNVDIARLLAFHRSHGKAATVTATRPPARFGGISFTEGRVTTFIEKPQIGEGWINGGFFVFEPRRARLPRRSRRCHSGTRADGAPGRRRGAGGVSPRRLLAVHGHAARRQAARGAVVVGHARRWKTWTA
jgi:glucose-1-phosphate cytidylyltransferase